MSCLAHVQITSFEAELVAVGSDHHMGDGLSAVERPLQRDVKVAGEVKKVLQTAFGEEDGWGGVVSQRRPMTIATIRS